MAKIRQGRGNTGKTGYRYVTIEGDVAAKDGQPIYSRNGKGLLKIRAQELLSASDVLLAASGVVSKTLRMDKDTQAMLIKLGEHYGLWGPGRKPIKPDETDVTPAQFSANAESS